MKKIFAFLVCAFLICAMPLVAFAEEITDPASTEAVVTEEQTTIADTTAVEEVTETEAETEAVTEVTEETEAVTEVTESVTGANTEVPLKETIVLTTDGIVKWVEEHLEEIIVVVTMVISAAYQAVMKLSLNKSVALCNNNAVSAVENSNDAINFALSKVEETSASVDRYKEEIATLLAEIRRSDEEKKKLETAFAEASTYLKTAKLANMELANEVAELLVLANIPNSKKDELYARHRAAVATIDAVDTIVNENTEVTDNVGEES